MLRARTNTPRDMRRAACSMQQLTWAVQQVACCSHLTPYGHTDARTCNAGALEVAQADRRGHLRVAQPRPVRLCRGARARVELGGHRQEQRDACHVDEAASSKPVPYCCGQEWMRYPLHPTVAAESAAVATRVRACVRACQQASACCCCSCVSLMFELRASSSVRPLVVPISAQWVRQPLKFEYTSKRHLEFAYAPTSTWHIRMH
jgi:hypothetical protein